MPMQTPQPDLNGGGACEGGGSVREGGGETNAGGGKIIAGAGAGALAGISPGCK